MNEVLSFLSSTDISKDEYVVLGLSGGPDSMCLLDILINRGYKVVCAHINHNIRTVSTKEAKFLKNYCEKKDILFECLELEKGQNGESYYRKKRYQFYKETAQKYNTKYIMTAHHGDDLIETVLMRITRGSNLKGYSGFTEIYEENGFVFLKPLIHLSKEEVISYNEKKNVPYFLDETNEEDVYTRNRFRHHVLPFLKEENKHVNRKFLKFSKELEETQMFIEGLVLKQIAKNYKENSINLNHFLKLDKFLQRKELEYILNLLYGDDVDKLKVIHSQKILDLLDEKKNFSIDLPCGLRAICEYDMLRFEKKSDKENYCYELKEELILPNGYTIKKVEKSNDKSNYTAYLNSNDLKLPLYVRNRKDGDRIEIKNLNGHKKVKSIFIDEKICKKERDVWPLLVDSEDNILWIPGLRKSKLDSENIEKCDIILRYERKENINEE